MKICKFTCCRSSVKYSENVKVDDGSICFNGFNSAIIVGKRNF